MARDAEAPPLRGDESEFFDAHAERLRKSIGRAINTSPDNIDDACAFAWMQFIRKQPERDTAYNWLWKVAWREALRLDRGARHVLPTEGVGEGSPAKGELATEVSQLIDTRAAITNLPPLQRDALILHGAGFNYSEAAKRLGVTRPRLNRALVKAHHQLRSEASVMPELPDDGSQPPRARLLAELTREPPRFLRAAIGKAPSAFPQLMPRRLEWSRLALAIVDYRLERGITDPANALGVNHDDPARRALERDIARYDFGRKVLPPRGLDR